MIPDKIQLFSSPLIRNEQAGDWQFVNTVEGSSCLLAKSAPLKDPRYQFLIQFHEMIEAILCEDRDISDEEVTAFDEKFEAERAQGLHSSTDEDGDDPRAPYHKEHFTATTMERMMAAELGVDWKEYEQAIADYFHA